jgi:hypothetical protein
VTTVGVLCFWILFLGWVGFVVWLAWHWLGDDVDEILARDERAEGDVQLHIYARHRRTVKAVENAGEREWFA